MLVVRTAVLEGFGRDYPDARSPIKRWLKTVQSADWRNFRDVRQLFGKNVDGVVTERGTRVEVFDVHSGHYRLIAKIIYEKRQVVILEIMTHAEYDTDRWKKRM